MRVADLSNVLAYGGNRQRVKRFEGQDYYQCAYVLVHGATLQALKAFLGYVALVGLGA